MKIAISGYYGFGNAGDEAILEAIRSGLAETHPDSKISILGAGHRFDLKMIADCDLLISGGGGLLQDKTSVRSFLYYISIILTAKLLSKKVYVFAQGIGPITKWYDRFLLKRIMNLVDLITVRDIDSFNYLKSLKLKNPKIIETADPTFILPPEIGPNAKKLLQLEGVQLNKRPLIGVAIRKIGENDPDKIILAKALDELIIEARAQIIFLPFQFPQDVETSREIMKMMKEKATLIFRECQPREIMGLISWTDLIIGMRLHSLIFAVNCGIPAVGLSYDPKVQSFMEEVSLPHFPSDSFSSNELVSAVSELLANREGVINNLKSVRRKLVSKAMTNFGMINLLK